MKTEIDDSFYSIQARFDAANAVSFPLDRLMFLKSVTAPSILRYVDEMA